MKKKSKIIVSLIMAAALAVSALTFTACGKNGGDTVSVTYNLNYEGQTRDVSVREGSKLKDWKPVRDGYTVEGWYTDANCTKSYDFGSVVKKGVTLYAKWIPVQGSKEVTFDFNCAGRTPVKLAVKQNAVIAEMDVPEISRVGMNFDGWYIDKDGTTIWDFENGKVTENITLYAKYSFDGSVKRDEFGKPIFGETVTDDGGNEKSVPTEVLLSPNFGWGPETELFPALIDAFNKEYEGKIHVSFENWDGVQETHALRFQQTYQTWASYRNYYNVADVYALAGLDFDADDWYAGVSRDSTIRGELKSIPIAAHAAYVIYNKALMQKYNGDNELPKDYPQLSALLSKAYAEEIKTNESFKTFVTDRGWMFVEGTSNVAFMQNDSDVFEYDGSRHYVNRWYESDENTARAINAIENMYGLIGANGKDKGAILGNEGNDRSVYNAVKSGDAMMGIVNFPDNRLDIVNDSALGIMPISGLFATGDTENKNAIPVNTMGFHFYKGATDVTNTQLAAAAVFADYVSRNSAMVGNTGFFPCRKSAVEKMFTDMAENNSVKLLAQIGNPENLRTFEGNPFGRTNLLDLIYNRQLLPILQGDGLDLPAKIKKMRNLVCECIY